MPLVTWNQVFGLGVLGKVQGGATREGPTRTPGPRTRVVLHPFPLSHTRSQPAHPLPTCHPFPHLSSSPSTTPLLSHDYVRRPHPHHDPRVTVGGRSVRTLSTPGQGTTTTDARLEDPTDRNSTGAFRVKCPSEDA